MTTSNIVSFSNQGTTNTPQKNTEDKSILDATSDKIKQNEPISLDQTNPVHFCLILKDIISQMVESQQNSNNLPPEKIQIINEKLLSDWAKFTNPVLIIGLLNYIDELSIEMIHKIDYENIMPKLGLYLDEFQKFYTDILS